jgi:hypothetical protein
MDPVNLRHVMDWVNRDGPLKDSVGGVFFVVWLEAMYTHYRDTAVRPIRPKWGSEESRAGFMEGFFISFVTTVFGNATWKVVDE